MKFKRIQNPYGTGLVWLIEYPDGKTLITRDSASGHGMFKKRDMIRMYADRKLTN